MILENEAAETSEIEMAEKFAEVKVCRKDFDPDPDPSDNQKEGITETTEKPASNGYIGKLSNLIRERNTFPQKETEI